MESPSHVEQPTEALLSRHDRLRESLRIPHSPELYQEIKQELGHVTFELLMRQVEANGSS